MVSFIRDPRSYRQFPQPLADPSKVSTFTNQRNIVTVPEDVRDLQNLPSICPVPLPGRFLFSPYLTLNPSARMILCSRAVLLLLSSSTVVQVWTLSKS